MRLGFGIICFRFLTVIVINALLQRAVIPHWSCALLRADYRRGDKRYAEKDGKQPPDPVKGRIEAHMLNFIALVPAP